MRSKCKVSHRDSKKSRCGMTISGNCRSPPRPGCRGALFCTSAPKPRMTSDFWYMPHTNSVPNNFCRLSTAQMSKSPRAVFSSTSSQNGTLTVHQRVRLPVTTQTSTSVPLPCTMTLSAASPMSSSCARLGWVTASPTPSTSAMTLPF